MSQITPPLSSEHRNQLSRAVAAARVEAEAGAHEALEALAVHHHEPFSHMDEAARRLRNRLRAHGRQLGDERDERRGTQAIGRLAHEVAFEHWHRMLFARFLAETDLLLHPDAKVPVSLDECVELAHEAGRDPWQLAAEFAQAMLPQIFRQDDPSLAVTLPPERRARLEKIVTDLPQAVFTASDSLGWTYQFWQSQRKDEVNRSGSKIGADEISAVTQLFTEHYMVLFLLHNTIGAWRAGKLLAANPSLAATATSEKELRDAVRLSTAGGYEFEYLRFVRTPVAGDAEGAPTGPWRPAAGCFDAWPRDARSITVLDPCCGSGHFLTAFLDLFARLRMDEEGLSAEQAVRATIAENLHALELDGRCTQIAAFNLAMAAWRLAGRAIELPAMSIACSGLAVGSTKAEWVKVAGGDPRLRAGMEGLYDLFEQAPTLGSLLDPRTIGGEIYDASFEELAPLLAAALAKESAADAGSETAERMVAAQGMALAADLMARRYTLAITNVPYLGRGQQDAVLTAYADRVYPLSKSDLATMFVERMLQWVEPSGTIAAVTPQNWLFLKSYQKLRERLLKERSWEMVARLGPKGFQTPMWDFNVMLLTISASRADDDHVLTGVDVAPGKTAPDKATLLRGEMVAGLGRDPGDFAVKVVAQSASLLDASRAIQLVPSTLGAVIGDVAMSVHGLTTGDNERLVLRTWELSNSTDASRYQLSSKGTALYQGLEAVLKWRAGEESLRAEIPGFRGDGIAAWNRAGLGIGRVGDLTPSVYLGTPFSHLLPVLLFETKQALLAAVAFTRSIDFNRAARTLHQGLSMDGGYLTSIPFDLDHWTKVAAEKYPNGLPEPQSNDPTQWLFHGHPAGMLEAGDAREPNPSAVLQVAVARVLGYRWPPELDPAMRLDARAREWVAKCDSLLDCVDDDGIVCLQAVRGEIAAADRVRAMLAQALGSDWTLSKERELLAAIAAEQSTDKKTVKPAGSIEAWLRERFFEEHCRLFHHRPFIWHLWDGRADGFNALVNCHRLTGLNGEGRRTLEKIAFTYLRDWIDRQSRGVDQGEQGAEARLAAAESLQAELEQILKGDAPYDLFVRWKPLHEQAVGWNPDINDGVRLNIRPFLKARDLGKKGAGVLRAKPNIKWGKDRGKEPHSIRPRETFPWFWGCDPESRDADRTDFAGGKTFTGDRWNDLHYTLAAKQQARKAAAATTSGGRS